MDLWWADPVLPAQEDPLLQSIKNKSQDPRGQRAKHAACASWSRSRQVHLPPHTPTHAPPSGLDSLRTAVCRPLSPGSLTPTHTLVGNGIMDSWMLRDEAARDRVRQALEFLDPRRHFFLFFFFVFF